MGERKGDVAPESFQPCSPLRFPALFDVLRERRKRLKKEAADALEAAKNLAARHAQKRKEGRKNPQASILP